jgi:uncharacterized protein (DUF488 family)
VKDVYMIGHSNQPFARFVELLNRHDIEVLIDVRTYARSRWAQFSGKALAVGLAGHGIGYEHRPRLGGKNVAPAEELREEMGAVMENRARVCLMCSEGNYLDCHRHHLLAPVVREMGHRVLQIHKDGSATEC